MYWYSRGPRCISEIARRLSQRIRRMLRHGQEYVDIGDPIPLMWNCRRHSLSLLARLAEAALPATGDGVKAREATAPGRLALTLSLVAGSATSGSSRACARARMPCDLITRTREDPSIPLASDAAASAEQRSSRRDTNEIAGSIWSPVTSGRRSPPCSPSFAATTATARAGGPPTARAEPPRSPTRSRRGCTAQIAIVAEQASPIGCDHGARFEHAVPIAG